MQPRERVFAAFHHQPYDRASFIPKMWIDLAANVLALPYVDVLNDPALAMDAVVQAALQLQLDGARLFTFARRQVVESDDEYRHIGADGALLGRLDIQGGWATQCIDDAQFDVSDPEMIATYQFWRTAQPAIKNRADVERIAIPTALFYDQAGYGAMVDAAITIAGDQLALIGDCSSGTLAFHVALRGLTQAMLDLVDDAALVQATMDKGIQFSLERAKFFIRHGITLLRYNDSVANMSVISPRHWRQFILPPLKFFCAEVHRFAPNAKIYCHICGNVMPVLADLAASGLDCIAPLDPLGGFSVAQVREKIGKEMLLMGGVNTLSFVESTPTEIADEASRCLREGGNHFILGSGCVLPRASRLENLHAIASMLQKGGC